MGKGRRENEGEKTRGGWGETLPCFSRHRPLFSPGSRARIIFAYYFSRSPCVRADTYYLRALCSRRPYYLRAWNRLVNFKLWRIWTGLIYSLPRICAVSTKLRNFQFKFLHRRIATNSFLFKIRIPDTALCYLCKTDEETLIHLYWECFFHTFWQSVKEFFVSTHLIPASHFCRHVWMFRLRRRGRWCITKPLFAPCKILYLLL